MNHKILAIRDFIAQFYRGLQGKNGCPSLPFDIFQITLPFDAYVYIGHPSFPVQEALEYLLKKRKLLFLLSLKYNDQIVSH
jgi:hypothetical protein